MTMKSGARRILDLGKRAFEVVYWPTLALRAIRKGKRHSLGHDLIVSLTSHPPRFSTLHLTLRTLRNQSVSPDRIILWIAHGDLCRLPPNVRNMPDIEIRACADLKSYNKIIDALKTFPDAAIVTADDDLYYPRNWLRDLVDGYSNGEKAAVAHRVYRVGTRGSQILPVLDWIGTPIEDVAAPAQGLFFASGAGVLFPPNSLHPDVVRDDLFKTLAPHCDDTWLVWMTYRAGSLIKWSGKRYALHGWPRTIRGSLWLENGTGRMDRYIKAMSDYFGPTHNLKEPCTSPGFPSAPE